MGRTQSPKLYLPSAPRHADHRILRLLEVLNAHVVVAFAHIVVAEIPLRRMDAPAVDNQLIVHEDAHAIVWSGGEPIVACTEVSARGPDHAEVVIVDATEQPIERPKKTKEAL